MFLQYKKECKLTIELLDTDHEAAEDPVEVERWSEYVEKYVNNEDTVTDELKDMLSRKPVFLQRQIEFLVVLGLFVFFFLLSRCILVLMHTRRTGVIDHTAYTGCMHCC